MRQFKKPINIVLLFVLFFELLYFVASVYAVDTNTNLTDLTVLASADCDGDTILYVVDDPNGTPAPRKIGRYEFLLGWAGSANITTLGTIATGTWEGDVIDHERGGLEADVSGYSGLVAISGGSTSEVDAKSELEAQIADVSDFAMADGDTYSGAHDFGGADSIEIVNGTDPDVDAAGEIAFDTDGANITNDAYYRGYDGSNQFAFGHKLKWIQGTVILPNDLADGERDALCIFKNKTGTTITIVAWDMESGTDDTTLNIEETDADGQNNSTVDAVEIATNGTGIYYGSDTTITAGTIEAEHRVLLDFDDTDTPDYVKFSIGYWENADVD
jgi:hypothetical protein